MPGRNLAEADVCCSEVESRPCRPEKSDFTPSRNELLREHEIKIQFLNAGVIVIVGCKSIAFSTVNEAMAAVNAYVNDPVTETEKWIKVFDENK